MKQEQGEDRNENELGEHRIRSSVDRLLFEDAKGLVRAGIEGFTHLVRDKDIDDEFIHCCTKPFLRMRSRDWKSNLQTGDLTHSQTRVRHGNCRSEI
jgi:hypothetical protein